MRVVRRFLILCMALAVLLAGFTLSSCDCPAYYGAIARVRLLNGDLAGMKMVWFYFYHHGAPLNPEDAVASGILMTLEEEAEYATKDGEIYVFTVKVGVDDTYDMHIFVDMDTDEQLSTGDWELLVPDLFLIDNYLVEVDYLDFTEVD